MSLNEFDLVIKASFAILLYVLDAPHLSEDKNRPTSCSDRTVWWLFYILRWKKAVSGKVSGGVPCSMCARGLGHADKASPSPSAHPSVRDDTAILNLLPRPELSFCAKDGRTWKNVELFNLVKVCEFGWLPALPEGYKRNNSEVQSQPCNRAFCQEREPSAQPLAAGSRLLLHPPAAPRPGCQLELIQSHPVRRQAVLSSSSREQHRPANRFLSVAVDLACSVCHRMEVLHVLLAFLCLNIVILQV